MRKNIGKKMVVTPQPVLMIGTYDENNVPNMMNAAWGCQIEPDQVLISLSEHKTTDNLRLKKEFTLSFATVDTMLISDYFGVESGRKVNKIEKAKVHVEKAEFVDAPIILEYPLTVECKVVSLNDGILIGEVVNTNVDESILTDGKIDLSKLKPIIFDAMNNTYRSVGDIVGKAFFDGLKLK